MKVGASSPAGHEVGLPLFYLFNQGTETDTYNNSNYTAIPPYFYRSTVDTVASDDDSDNTNINKNRIHTCLESIFPRCFHKCFDSSSHLKPVTCGTNDLLDKETILYESSEHITEHLSNELNELFQGKLVCTRQHMLKTKDGRNKRMIDMMLSTPSDETLPSSCNAVIETSNATDPVAIYEIGLRAKNRWHKFEHGGQAVKTIMDSRNPHIISNLLLFVLTYDVQNKQTSIPSSNMAGNEITGKDMIKDWCVAVFLCWKMVPDTNTDDRKKNQYHTSLLWRSDGGSLETLSIAFAKTLYATQQLAYWRNQKDERYMYLGPHCCRFTNPDGQQVRC
jgi:hypothetical protein